MNRLSDLNIKAIYNSYKDDIAKDFYDEVLSSAVYYDRVSAYFDSKILSYYSRGIENIYKNGGKIRFVFSQELTESDFKLMVDGYNSRAEKILENNYDRIELDETDKRRLSNLAFLIEQGVVEIKIAFLNQGILHDKLGLIYDNDSNCIYFRGSNNETVAAINSNHERFEVSCTWNAEENENLKIREAKDYFERLWINNEEGVRVINIPDVIMNKIAEYNQGKIILKEEQDISNSLFLDINGNNHITLLNNIENFAIENSYDYVRYLKYLVTEIVNNVYDFGKQNYIYVKDIISHLEDLSKYNNVKLVISDKVTEYIRIRTYEIEKTKEIGNLIKKHDSSIMPYFSQFEKIVNRELSRELRPKQMWDAFFAAEMIKSANYSVPGSGKTSIVYGMYSYLTSKEKNKVDNLIMIGPLSSFKSWKDEYVQCFGNKRGLKLINISECKNKNDKEYQLKYNSSGVNLILINYEQLPYIENILCEIINERTLLVFDEVHKVKAIDGVWASSALKISENAKYKVVLTGTPIPNSYADLYNQYNILYTDEYSTYFNLTPAELSSKNINTMEKVNDLIYPFFVRTTKKDLSIPLPNTDDVENIPMDSKEAALFSMLHKKFARNPLALFIRLLQASTNPKLVYKKIDYDLYYQILDGEEEIEDKINKNDYYDQLYNQGVYEEDDSGAFTTEEADLINSIDMTSKFWSGVDLVNKLVNENKPVLCWGIFVNTLDRIKTELLKRKIPCEVICGGVSLSRREEIIEDFKSGKIKVLIANPHTMAESVSLHMVCHDAVYFEYSFNLTHMLQSRDRINRLGLSDDEYTQYYYLTLVNNIDPAEDSIDIRTYDRLKEKESIMIHAIEDEKLQEINFDLMDDIRRILNMN